MIAFLVATTIASMPCSTIREKAKGYTVEEITTLARQQGVSERDLRYILSCLVKK